MLLQIYTTDVYVYSKINYIHVFCFYHSR